MYKYKVGVVPGKFFPPHRGHLYNFITCSTMCEKTYVVVSDNMLRADAECKRAGLPEMPLRVRSLWLFTELKNLPHIKVLTLDESDIPPYPEGTEQWCNRLKEVVPEKFDVIFGGDVKYKDTYMQSFPGVDYVIRDRKEGRFPVSGTKIREDPFKHWDYILGSARSAFTRRVLITGTEDCGKTTLTKYLGKIYNTSWTECGRYYSWEERKLDNRALKTANRIVFFDTDVVATQYYYNTHLSIYGDHLSQSYKPDKYDVVLLMCPNVKHLQKSHEKLRDMYLDYGFRNIIEIDGDYNARLEKAMKVSDRLLSDRRYMSRY